MMNADADLSPRPCSEGKRAATGKQTCQCLLERISLLGLPYGREDSFKMGPGRMSQDRILIGLESAILGPETFFDIAFELGMPPQCQPLLMQHMAQANALFFGLEERAEGSVCKADLEFWDQVCAKVTSCNTREPQLLHLGVKWDRSAPDRYELARYTCFPFLDSPAVLRRMIEIYPPEGPHDGLDSALGIVRAGIRRKPSVYLLYLEASESDNPRRSFDVNLYKTGLRVQDVARELREAAIRFGVAEELVEVQLQTHGHRLLGHLSGGIDRHGSEFLTVYAEICPL